MIDKNLLSDRPIFKQEEDRFQRYNFSKRIAQSILEQENTDSLVIGIYGAWGEGKSSVLNFIEKELEEKVLIVKFNPWRYNDEEKLLRHFLKKIAKELNKELETKKEKIGGFISKYGTLTNILGMDISKIGDSLAEIDLEELKERVDEFLKESEKRLVIFIDDIDRLDKQEIYSIFRLVKLTGDFKKTTYILSFDENMVASAIGERFGEGNQQAGLNFLEKIVQVPLKIPKAQTSALKKYCFELVDKVIKVSNVELSDKNVGRFVNEFNENILLRLNTPRLAIRYINSLSFSLPLLRGEVNVVDLMLIEAIKIFYPDVYEFIKKNPNLFVSSYSYNYGLNQNQDKTQELITGLDKLSTNLSKREKEAVRNLLEELFPFIQGALKNIVWDNSISEWVKEKRIATPRYFPRYFSYAVIEGDISDVAFEDFIMTIPIDSGQEVLDKMTFLIKESNADNFLIKMRVLEKDLEWETSKKLIRVIAQNNGIFPNETNSWFSFDNPNYQSALLIYKLMERHDNRDEVFSLAKELISSSKPLEYAYNLNNLFRGNNDKKEQIFIHNEYIELAKLILDRALNEAGEQPLFEIFTFADYLLVAWSEMEKDAVLDYTYNMVNKNPEKYVITLLKAFTPTVRSSNQPEPYKGDLKKIVYDYLKGIIDIEFFYNKIQEVFGEKLIEDDTPIYWDVFDNKQTDLKLLKQFLFWYEEDSKLI